MSTKKKLNVDWGGVGGGGGGVCEQAGGRLSLEVVTWSNKKHTLNGQGHKDLYD